MAPYFGTDENSPAKSGNRKAKDHVGLNPQLPPVLEALQCEPQRAEPARRPRTGRYRHHPIGHSAGRMGQREPLRFSARSNLQKAPAPCGRFRFLAPRTQLIWTLSLAPPAPLAEASGRSKHQREQADPGCPP